MHCSRNRNLDIVRGIAVLFVVFIHINFPGIVGGICSDLGVLCNALFFLLSGYFVLNNSKSKVIKKAVKCLLLTFGTYLIYVITYSCGPKDVIFNLVYNLPKVFIANVAFCNNMWFAVALMYCYLIYSLIGERKYRHILVGLLILNVAFSPSLGMYRFLFSTFTYGIPLFFLGNYIAEKKENEIFCVDNHTIILCIIVGILLNLFDVIDANKFHCLHVIGGVLYAVFSFIWVISSRNINTEKMLIKVLIVIGSKYYLWFYVFQYLTIDFVHSIFKNETGFVYVDWLLPFVVVVFLFIESAVIDAIIKFTPKVYKYVKGA